MQKVAVEPNAASHASKPYVRAEDLEIAGGVGRLRVGHFEAQLKIAAVQQAPQRIQHSAADEFVAEIQRGFCEAADGG